MNRAQRLYSRLRMAFREAQDQDIAARVGVSKGTISAWKNGSYGAVTADNIFACADAMGVDRMTLLGWVYSDDEVPKVRINYNPKAPPP